MEQFGSTIQAIVKEKININYAVVLMSVDISATAFFIKSGQQNGHCEAPKGLLLEVWKKSMQLSGHRWALKGLLFEMQKKIYNLMVIRRLQNGYFLRLKMKMCNIKVSKRALNGLLYATRIYFFYAARWKS